MKKYLFVLLLAISIPALLITVPSIKHATAQEQGIWIDVRTQSEWDEGHLQQAIHIPYQNISKEITAITTDKRQPIFVYCRSGNRSEIAARTLEKMGFVNVQNRGGYKELKRQGL